MSKQRYSDHKTKRSGRGWLILLALLASDPGVYAVPIGRLIGEGEERLEVASFGSVDPHTLGSYTIRYSTRYLFSDYETERRVNVVDTTPPEIELKHLEGYEPT